MQFKMNINFKKVEIVTNVTLFIFIYWMYH